MVVRLPHHYAMLGLSSDATREDVREAYRRAAQRWHPDALVCARRAPDSGRMAATTEAFETLDEPARRAAYDAALKDALDDRLAKAARGPLAQLVDRVIGIRQAAPASGRNRRMRLDVPFADALGGFETTIELDVADPCDACDGEGFGADGRAILCGECAGVGEIFSSDLLRSSWSPCKVCDQRGYHPEPPCAVCRGRGQVSNEKRLVIPIPAQVESGTVLRVRGAGEPPQTGGPAGDLLVEVTVLANPFMSRRGRDLLIMRPIPFWLALTGGTIEVPTPSGCATLKLPPGARDRETLRLERWGFGVGEQRGDAFVTLIIEWPEGLDESARNALITWGRALSPESFPETARFESDLLAPGRSSERHATGARDLTPRSPS